MPRLNECLTLKGCHGYADLANELTDISLCGRPKRDLENLLQIGMLTLRSGPKFTIWSGSCLLKPASIVGGWG